MAARGWTLRRCLNASVSAHLGSPVCETRRSGRNLSFDDAYFHTDVYWCFYVLPYALAEAGDCLDWQV